MRKILVILLIAVIGLGAYIFYQDKYTTYGEVTSALILDGTVNRVVIHNPRSDFRFETSDIEIIEKIIYKPSNMSIKRNNEIPTIDYFMYIYTENSTIDKFDIALGEDKIHIWNSYYKVTDDNKLYMIIQNIESSLN